MNARLPKSFAGFTSKPPKFWPRWLIGLVTGSEPEVQAPRDTAVDDLVLRLLISTPWLSVLPLVGICFTLPLDCLTSHATRWEHVMSTYLLL